MLREDSERRGEVSESGGTGGWLREEVGVRSGHRIEG